MSAEKRAASEAFGTTQMVVKRQKSVEPDSDRANGAITKSGARPSGLLSPTMELSGHSSEVFVARFDPQGQLVASGSMDRTIMLWKSTGACENIGVLSGHKGAVLDLHWSRDSRVLYSAATDATLASWDTETGQRIRRHIGHDDLINAMDVTRRGEEMLASASDDGTIGIWDPRQKNAVDHIETDFPVTAVAFAEAAHELFTGSIDNEIKTWDLRKMTVSYTMKGHTDTITSLSVSPDSNTLLSNAHDSTVRTWDIRPFAPSNRHVSTYDGAPTGMEKNLLKASWDFTGDRIAAGSGDRSVVIWETRTGKILAKLPGHQGAVNDTRFSPSVPNLIMSGSSDATIVLGEITA